MPIAAEISDKKWIEQMEEEVHSLTSRSIMKNSVKPTVESNLDKISEQDMDVDSQDILKTDPAIGERDLTKLDKDDGVRSSYNDPYKSKNIEPLILDGKTQSNETRKSENFASIGLLSKNAYQSEGRYHVAKSPLNISTERESKQYHLGSEIQNISELEQHKDEAPKNKIDPSGFDSNKFSEPKPLQQPPRKTPTNSFKNETMGHLKIPVTNNITVQRKTTQNAKQLDTRPIIDLTQADGPLRQQVAHSNIELNKPNGHQSSISSLVDEISSKQISAEVANHATNGAGASQGTIEHRNQ